jgi:hypothetical protein
MRLVESMKRLFRRRPLTPEDLAARAEAAQIRDQVQDDRGSQRSSAGMIYRSRGR